MEIWSLTEEAERLKKRFATVSNRAEFARAHKVPGGQAMIYQHITGRRPIGMDAALSYAEGFGIPLEEISPRLAEEARKSLRVSKLASITESAFPKATLLASPEDVVPDSFTAETIQRALVALEEGLEQAGVELPTSKKAEALVMVCSLMATSTLADERPVIARLLRLVA